MSPVRAVHKNIVRLSRIAYKKIYIKEARREIASGFFFLSVNRTALCTGCGDN